MKSAPVTFWIVRLGAALDVLVQENLALPVEDAEVHGLGVQIDSAVVMVRFGVKSHRVSFWADALVFLHPAYSMVE
jgi:hypothetical protein